MCKPNWNVQWARDLTSHAHMNGRVTGAGSGSLGNVSWMEFGVQGTIVMSHRERHGPDPHQSFPLSPDSLRLNDIASPP